MHYQIDCEMPNPCVVICDVALDCFESTSAKRYFRVIYSEETKLSKTFVLLHGSWQGGWIWEEVIRRLEAKGHRAYAPTMPGHGPGVERAGITHKDCVNSIVAYITERNLHDVVLLGHSFGGSVISKVVEQIPNRISRLIYLNAFVLEDGQCIFDNLPEAYIEAFSQMAQASPDNTMQLPWEIWKNGFLQDVPEDVARAVWERTTPEPNQVNLDKLDLKIFYSLDVPKSFLFLRQDLALPPGYFHPRMSSRLGKFKLVEMDGSHEVMFSRPAELTEKIVEASGD